VNHEIQLSTNQWFDFLNYRLAKELW
jgi:hypothetical protein